MINDYPIFTYGLGDNINDKLNDIIINNIKDPSVRVIDKTIGRRTRWTLHHIEIKEVQLIVNWITHLTPQICQHFIRNPQRKDDIQDPGFNPYWLKIVEMWGLHYKKGESLNIHNHFPFTISFVYYVRLPQGSSPLIVENKKVKMEEGDCIFFLASDYHSVKYNKCDGRCTIVGNELYYP